MSCTKKCLFWLSTRTYSSLCIPAYGGRIYLASSSCASASPEWSTICHVNRVVCAGCGYVATILRIIQLLKLKKRMERSHNEARSQNSQAIISLDKGLKPTCLSNAFQDAMIRVGNHSSPAFAKLCRFSNIEFKDKSIENCTRPPTLGYIDMFTSKECMAANK